MDLSINPKSVPIATNTIVIIYDDTNSIGSISKSFILLFRGNKKGLRRAPNHLDKETILH